jgi:trimeric autotransporter adhesin
MSKNLTRKGLVFGAVVALGSTLFAGAPAQAAAGIDLTDLNNKGTYGMLEAETFAFLASGNADFNAASQLRVKVKNVLGSANAVTPLIGSAAPTAVNYATSGATATALGTAAGDTAVFAVASMTSPFQFKLTSGAIAASTTEQYEVTVWADSNNNGVIDTTGVATPEIASATRTVTFYDVASLAPSITIDDAIQGASATGADITIPNISIDQLTAAEWGVRYSTGLDAVLGTGDVADVVALSTDKTKFESDLAFTGSLAANSVVKAQVIYKNAGLGALDIDTLAHANATTLVGSAATKSVVALKAAAITASVLASSESTTSAVKTDGTAVFQALVEDDTHGAATADPVVGNKVTAKVEVFANDGLTVKTLSSTVFVEINGVKYTDATKLPGATGVDKLALVTDAKGLVNVSVKVTGLDGTGANAAATDNVKVSFTTETLAAVNATAEVNDAAYTAYALASNGNVATTTDGAAVSVPVAVYDQFGGVPGAGYEVLTTLSSSANFTGTGEVAPTAASETKASLVSGKATLTITDNSTGTGEATYAIDVKKLTGNTYGSAIASIASFVVKIRAAAELTPGTIDVTAGTTNATTKVREIAGPVALDLADYGTWDERAVSGTEPTVTAEQSLTGTVSTAATATSAAALVEGTKVTLSGAGLLFHSVVDSKDVYTLDSATVYTNASGAFDVRIASHKAGKQTVVITAGSVSQTVTVVFAQADDNAGTSLVVDAPANILPGRTLVVTGTVTDKFGNAVNTTGVNTSGDGGADLSVAYDGPGLIVGSLPTETDADGKFTFRVLLGASETGSATVTAKYDANGDADYADTGDLTVAKTVSIGAAPVVATAAASGSTGKFFASVTNAAGKKVVVKVSGKFVTSFTGTEAKKSVAVAALKGNRTVTIYVGGTLVLTKLVTIK